MSSQNLIIYKFISLYHILEELDLDLDLNFKIIYIDSEKSLNSKLKSLNNYLVVSNKKNMSLNQVILDNIPMKIFKLIEMINIEFLKLRFNNQSHMKINNYIIFKLLGNHKHKPN